MPKMLEAGHYLFDKLIETGHRDPPKQIGIIRGDVANETDRTGFYHIIGLSSSKWYVYEWYEYTQRYEDQSGTGILSVSSLKFELDSKAEAVEKAKQRYDV